MKKKFLYGLFAFVVTMFTVVVVHADAHTITSPARTMSFTPDEGSQLYAIADDNAFNEFAEKVQFSASTGTEKITPKTDDGVTKIILTTSPNMSAAATLDITKTASELAGSDWFTAYCLDGGRKYPRTSIFNMGIPYVSRVLNATYTLADSTVVPKADRQIGATTLIAVLNNNDLNSLFSNYEGYNQQIEIVYALEGVTGDASLSTADFAYDNPAWNTPVSAEFLSKSGELMTSLKGGNKVTVLVKSITFNRINGTPGEVTAADLVSADANGAGTEGYYKITYDAKDILFDKYVTDKKNAPNYKHSLWIIEHSYPSMTLDALLAEVGSSKETLKSQILGLYGSETFTDAEVDNLLDNYVYWTVQYAMWKANDSFEADGKRLGNELYLGSLGTDNVLNTIYQYLIKDRDEYTNYGVNYSGKLTIDKTNNDKVTTSTDYYTYGPYTAKYDVIDPSDITLEVTSSNKDSVTFVDKDGKELTKVKNGQEFYVRCKKSAKVTNVDIKLSATGRSYDENQKGTIYYATYALNQNVITGLGYVDVQGNLTDSLTFNPKTGVPNIAIVFVITLIAFSLGYLALSYNNKAMELK